LEELVIYQILINNKIQEFEEEGELELPRERNYGIFSTFLIAISSHALNICILLFTICGPYNYVGSTHYKRNDAYI